MSWCWRVGGQHDGGRSSRRGGLLLSGPQQPGRMRERLVTSADAALIALSWFHGFHAHFREAAITAATPGSRSGRGGDIIY